MGNYKYLVLVIFAISIGCTNSKSNQRIQKQNGVIPKNKVSVIFKSKPSQIENSKSFYKVFDERHQNEQTVFEERNKDVLDIKKLQYPEAWVFIYDYQFSTKDTLEIYKDSIRFNSKLVRKIASKDFKFKDKTIRIYKYFHSGVGSVTNSTSNLYIVPTYGLVLRRVISQGSGFVELNTELEPLQKQIERDSVFFKFEDKR